MDGHRSEHARPDRPSTGPPTRWLIDGNNVMGSRPDGWWNDRPGAMARLAQEIATWCIGHDDDVTLVFDGREQPSVALLAGGNLSIRFAPRRGRNAADDVLVDLAVERAGPDLPEGPGPHPDPDGDLDPDGVPDAEVTVVVTADRGLRDRLPPSVDVLGPGRFLRLLAPPRA